AQENEVSEMAIRQGVATFMYAAQQQLIHLIEKGTEEYSEMLASPEPNMPAAWMLLENGETIKRIDIDSQAAEAPAQLRVIMYRAALKSVARRSKINAAAIFYTGKVGEDSDKEAMII